MSENMKKIYQAYADSIAPAPDMQERLKRQLYAEMQGERPRKRNYGRGQFSRWLVVACMLFLVSGGCLIYAVIGTSGQTGRADGRWIIGADTGGTRLLGEKNVADTDIARYPEKEKPWILQEISCFAARKMAVGQESRCVCRRMNSGHCANYCRVQQFVRM